MSLNKHQAETLQRKLDHLWDKGLGESDEAIEIGQHLFTYYREREKMADEVFTFPSLN